jgi:hypothetical protein
MARQHDDRAKIDTTGHGVKGMNRKLIISLQFLPLKKSELRPKDAIA